MSMREPNGGVSAPDESGHKAPPTAKAGARASVQGLRIGGFEKLSAVDWPGHLSAVVFCQGCGWRCGYCHNPHLIPFAEPEVAWEWNDIVAWLGRRRGLLDGVVFSGGEPTLQPGLCAAMEAVRALGFEVGLHTGGPVPENLAAVLPLVSWVGFDFKAPFDRYAQVTGHDHGGRARESFELVRAAGVRCEVRTTWHPRLLSEEDLVAMGGTLAAAGCTEWVIQRFRAEGCADGELRAQPVGDVPEAVRTSAGLKVCVR